MNTDEENCTLRINHDESNASEGRRSEPEGGVSQELKGDELSVTLVVVTSTTPRLVGIYDADATLWGELSYWVGARLGRRHCSLCDVTHGLFTKKASWEECASTLPFPFVTYHRNDMPSELHAVVGGGFPVIILDDGNEPSVLLTGDEIAQANASPHVLVELISSRIDSRELS